MWSIERLRRENLAIQTAIRNQLITGSESNFAVATSEPPNSGSRNISPLSSGNVETLLALHSQNALHQHLQSQQFAAIQASLLKCRADLSTTSTAGLRSDVTASLCQTLSSKMNGIKTNDTIPNSSRLILLADAINNSLGQGSNFGQDISHHELLSSLYLSSRKQTDCIALRTCSSSQDHSTKAMEKARAASFAPVRKKTKDSGAKPSPENHRDDTKDEILRLDKKPSKNVTKWHAMLESLKKFKESHGHCIVPRGYEDMKLASWVVEQRKQYRRYQENLSCCIDQARIDLLNDLGFTWDAQEAAWDRQMDHLREFHRIHGHCDVPRDDVQFSRLYLWIREQRRHYKLMKMGQSTLLTKARLDALKSVDFSFDSLGAIFTSRLQELSEFRRLHGHCHVPPGYSQNVKLFGWIQRMKKEYKLKMSGQRSTLSEAHIGALNELEFPWLSGKAEGPESPSSYTDDDCEIASASDDTLSTASSRFEEVSSSSVEFEKSGVRPLKKRRIL